MACYGGTSAVAYYNYFPPCFMDIPNRGRSLLQPVKIYGSHFFRDYIEIPLKK
jgi:hypothetical protein